MVEKMRGYRIDYVWLDELDPETGELERDHDHYLLVRQCPFCANESLVTVPAQGLWNWEHGKHIQDAFPSLSADEREQVMTGIHPECWSQAFAEEDGA